MITIAIIDYGSGNLRSVAKALEHVAGKEDSIRVTANPQDVLAATHIILPGVGAFADCIAGLNQLAGMRDALEQTVHTNKVPFLGICVGMQMLFETGYEHGTHVGLGWIEGDVVRITAPQSYKIPHMGWNTLSLRNPSHPLLAGIPEDSHAYFVHSYHAQCTHDADILATTEYGGILTAIVARDNIMGVQFHPEKSQATGLQLLKNFLTIGYGDL